MFFTWNRYTLLTSPLWTTKVCLCLLPLLFSSFVTSSSSLGSEVSGPQPDLISPQLWRQGYRQISLLLLMFLFLMELQEAVGRSLRNSVNNLTEKYTCCKSDVQRNNKSRGREGCPEQGKGLFLSGQCMWIKLLGRDTSLSNTDQVCPCDTREIVHSWVVPCVKCHRYWHAFPHWQVLNKLQSLGFDHTGQNLPYPTSAYQNG